VTFLDLYLSKLAARERYRALVREANVERAWKRTLPHRPHREPGRTFIRSLWMRLSVILAPQREIF
jgi:hypothetical protein